jgi:hypothetical protein
MQHEIIATYLIAEFEALHQRADQKEQLIGTKISGYLTSTSLIAGALLLVADSSYLQKFFLEISGGISTAISLIGIVTLIQVLDLRASAQFFYRRAGRIRKWFLTHASDLQPYLPFIVGDNTPPYLEEEAPLRSTEGIILLLNTISVCFSISISTWILGSRILLINTSTLLYTILFVICPIISCVVWLLQMRWIKAELQKRETSEQVRILFPYDEQWYEHYNKRVLSPKAKAMNTPTMSERDAAELLENLLSSNKK